jgi:glyoxylase-like metal-dependent hydrolase (beta-lactamase superfamily II)
VLVDTGMHEPGSLAHLERAMHMVNLRIEHVRLLVVTHAHADHFGQALPIVERAGCETVDEPEPRALRAPSRGPDAVFRRRIEVARQSGVPSEPLDAYAERRKEQGTGVAGWVEPARDAVEGVTLETDHGAWRILETPGHAPRTSASICATGRVLPLRRPPARAGLALLRLRLDARPRPGVPRLAGEGRSRSTRGCA